MANRTGDNSPLLVSRSRTHSQRDINQHDGDGGSVTSVSPTASGYDHHEDTVVPLEGRILRDAQGKVIFIGDCAPLSFLQTVRYLITAEVDPEGFAIQAARDSLIEVARPSTYHRQRPPSIPLHEVRSLVEAYTIATAGLVELFGHDELLEEIQAWANGLIARSDEASAAIFYLVLAIGAQESQEDRAEAWCDHARSLLLRHMCNSMNVSTVQGFTLITIFMLRAFQSNGAYLYFCKLIIEAAAVGI